MPGLAVEELDIGADELVGELFVLPSQILVYTAKAVLHEAARSAIAEGVGGEVEVDAVADGEAGGFEDKGIRQLDV